MHIVVGTRSTPDTAAKLEIAADGQQVNWGDSPLVINPWDEYAVEEALAQTKEHGGDVTVIAIGAEDNNEALKHAIAMGAKQAIRLWDDAWAGFDSLMYARLFAAAVEKLGDVDLAIFGKEAADDATDQFIFQTARQLGWTTLGYVANIAALDPGGQTLTVERLLDTGKETASAPLPAVLNVMKGINEPRYPSFMGIRKAAKANIPVWDAAELGAEAGTAQTTLVEYRALPVKAGDCEIIEADSVAAAAGTLADRLLAEKVV